MHRVLNRITIKPEPGSRRVPGAAPAAMLALIGLLCASGRSHAFPPAPFYTIYGDVRDQYGTLLSAGGGEVVISQSGREILRQSITGGGTDDYNYQARLRMDMLRAATSSYSSAAVTAGSFFSLAIDVGGVLYQPLEIRTAPTVGNPSDRRRLNLTMGVDLDGDGLPDAWEEAQLYQAGYLPDDDGWDLSLMDRDGDLDKDGISNYNEYLAGTYAGDRHSVLSLAIKEKLAQAVALEFYGFYGKSYTIESSTDLVTWTVVPFSVADPAAAEQSSLVASTSGITRIYSSAAAAGTFYRLNAR